MTKSKLLLFFFIVWLITGCTTTDPVPINIIPLPEQQVAGNSHFTFSKNTVIQVENREQEPIAGLLADLFTSSAGFTPMVNTGSSAASASVIFSTDTTLVKESYKLDITPSRISINAADKAGFFYAIQSIRQLLPPAIESKEPVNNIQWNIPTLGIQDSPRFPYRGLMLDVSRFFIPKENIIKIIDYMAMLKLNKLHLHLVDGNGWRLEIKKYPRLTEIGAWRVARESDF